MVALHDGHIISQGTVDDALKKDQKLAEEFEHDEQALELDETEEIEAGDSSDDTVVLDNGASGKLVIAEEIAVGHVSFQACKCRLLLHLLCSLTDTLCEVKLFLGGLGGTWPLLFWLQFIGSMAACDLSGVSETWWLGHWARQYALRDAGEVKVSL